jgi:endonuclease/exonuclease/phosphatase family metal-dependent hydrolase
MKIRKRWTCLLAVLLLCGGVWHASQHRPTGPAEGVEIQGAAFCTYSANNRSPSRFRIGTFNIHGCKGLDGRCDVDRVANYLKGLDFVALNEVLGPGLFKKQDQAEMLGMRLKMAWLFAPSIRQWYFQEAGNGLLSRIPVVDWHRIPLIRQVDYSFRNAVRADLRLNGSEGERVVHVLLTHLNRRYDSERDAQFKEVVSLFLELPEPAILMGDLNLTAENTQIRQLMSVPGVIDAVGQVHGTKDSDRIDWIFVRGLRCVDAGVLKNNASDHPMIWAELE